MSLVENLISSLIPSALAQAPAGGASPSGGPSFSFFVPLVLIFVIFYFLMIRPQQKQQKERGKMISELKKGDAVVTTSGIHARVVGTADKILTLEIADNVKVKVDRDAVARIDQPVGAVVSKQ
jgi:preprotein translocase subunit YajC